ncbi:hypothetical protein HNW77_10505 [Komagataeibacter sp. AV436]|uniref:Uncharacterized protein n=1 Tax=Komagataeibacter melomenusus TaxID=2766578 RepID=A0ABX2AEL9_9PROT|nr:hypothetical protein [Komagataeibacter melomenusus]MBV1831300.1 hypothetical protein [Komagataeibacter melomenusus]NPC66818.1 hypothetical protein [Komagataeibacter melomenusus]
MRHNNKIKKLFFPMLIMPLLGGCIHPHPPALPFNSNEVAWAQKPGHAAIRGCVSGAIFTRQTTTALTLGNNTVYTFNGIDSSIMQIPRVHFTVELLPESEYMHALAKKMEFYSHRLTGPTVVNDPRWVDASVLPFIARISCPVAGPDICPSIGHFVWPNLPAGQWYAVTSYDATNGDNSYVIDVQKITTVDGKTVPLVAWTGTRRMLCSS